MSNNWSHHHLKEVILFQVPYYLHHHCAFTKVTILYDQLSSAIITATWGMGLTQRCFLNL